ncbi:LOW QUALITY PROTEIN: zinc finger CCCH domain-containing protein 38-like [Pyrus x bretschneideri]|uniref:LOW QUALITY PROTEIN: zinc finger CCCH domain-containing protein 38-like n=1 Tax=Pyrus x bretschneideri TaxID=225117 RepID=UPI0005108F2C|nr:LOW QUALITY PROTEIN: zinc finger CCCH domain-containing protein 38-like [Pyrus x bretschneideri]
MNRTSRKRSSKWDLVEEPQFEDVNMQDNSWMGKAGRPFRPKESGRDWPSPETNDLQRPKHDLNLPSREPLPGSRGSHKHESTNKRCNRYMDDSMVWDGDENCSTRMSPGFDDWREHRSQSPKSGWKRSLRGRSRSRSRSRSKSQSWSRSPDRGYRRESLFLDRNRGRPGISAQLCKDYMTGRCRRASDCQFLHEGNSKYDDSWETRHRKRGALRYASPPETTEYYPLKSERYSVYCSDFVKGKCRKGASCKFDHHRPSDGFSKGSTIENTRERENERRNRDTSTERGAERVPHRSGDIPCKFFAAGNCRNKKYCRFSHHIQAYVSPERKSKDVRWGPGHSLNDAGPAWNGPKWSDTVTLSDAPMLTVDNRNIGVPEVRSSAWSVDDNRWGCDRNDENKNCVDRNVNHEAAERNEKDANLWKEDNVGACVDLPKSRDTEKWLGDMSPDWNYTVQSSNHVGKQEHGRITQGSEPSTLVHGAASIIEPEIAERSDFLQNKDLRGDGVISLPYDNRSAIEEPSSFRNNLSVTANIVGCQSFDNSGQSSSAFPFSGLSTIGQSQTLIPGRGIVKSPHDTLSPEGKSVNKLDIGDAKTSLVDGIPQVPSLVGGKELKQLTNLSASLAQLLGNRQQLPQIYAALNSHNAVSTPTLLPKSEGSSEQLLGATFQPDPAMLSHKPYDPICDSIEHRINNNQMCLLPNSAGNTSVDGNVEKLSNVVSPSSLPSGANTNNYHQTNNPVQEPTHKNHQLSQLERGAKPEVVKGNGELGAEEIKSDQEENNSPVNGPMEVTEKDGADGGKKLKEVKGSRAFKFALVENVKELLKPSWKEGQVSKDAYKTIVKKVVDKVTSTMQGANIPQTQEKIDHYLSFSKPKLTKLVQAYVEKMHKA